MSPLARALSGEWSDELLFETPPIAQAVDQTADGKHVVWFEDVDDGRVRASWDGVGGDPFTLVPQQSGDQVVWSPDRSRLAWFGQRESGLFVAVDGVEYQWDGITRSVPPTFSPDSRRVAFGVYVGTETRLVVDGELHGDWSPAPIRPAFSPDGSRLAFVAESRQLKKGERQSDYRQWVVLDGIAGPEAQGISADASAFQFSPDGRRFVYGVLVGQKVRLVLDGVQGEAFENLAYVTFSPDSARLVYATIEKNRFVIAGDVRGPSLPYWRIGPPVFSPDSARLAYIAADSKDRARAVIDGVPGPEFNDFWGNVEFSPDSRHTAYLGMRKVGGFLRRSTAVSLVRDGVVGATWDEVDSGVHFSPDSARTAFSARRGKDWVTVVDDVAGPAFVQNGPPQFSATGRLGYLAAEGPPPVEPRFRIVVEGIETPTFMEPTMASDTTSFEFSPDGEHVIAIGGIDRWWRPMVDNDVGPGGTGCGNVRFDGDTVSFLVLGEDGAHRVSTRLT